MARGVNIPIAADASGVISAGKKVEGALDAVIDSLDDVGVAGKDAGRDVGKGLAEGTTDAANEADRLERSFKESFEKVEKQSKATGDKIGDNTKKGYAEASRAAKDYEGDAEHAGKRASETTEEFKDEARANFSEVASSFSGDMSSATDLVQGTLGGLAGSLTGPVGLALGGLAAIGGAFAAAWQKAAEETKERVGEMYDDMLESGNQFLSESLIQTAVGKIMKGEEGRITDYADALDIAKEAGIDVAIVLRALAGDQLANKFVQGQLNDAITEGGKKFDEARANGEDYNAILEDTDGITGHIELLKKQQTEFSNSADKAKVAGDATVDYNDTLAALPREVRTELGLHRDIASEQDARAAYDGLGRPITTTISVVADPSSFHRTIRELQNGAYTVEVNGKSTGVRMT